MGVLKKIGNFLVKCVVAIGNFFKRFGLGIYHGLKSFCKGFINWFKRFGKRFKDSSTPTKVGHFVMGVGNIAHKQYTRGIIYLLVEILFFVFMFASPKASGTNLGFKAIGNFFTLGDAETMDVDTGVSSFGQDYEEVVKYGNGLVDENGKVINTTESIVRSAVRTNIVLEKAMANPNKYVTASDGKYNTQEMIVDKDFNAEKPDYYSYAEYEEGAINFGKISLPYLLWIECDDEIDLELADFQVKAGDNAPVGLDETGTSGIYERKGSEGRHSYLLIVNSISGRNLQLSIAAAAEAKYAEATAYSIGFDSQYVNTAVDNSFLMMLFGVFTIAIIVIFLMVYFNSIKSAYAADLEVREGKVPQNFKQDLKDFLGDKFHLTLLLPAIVFMVIFTIIPTVFMILISFSDFQTLTQMSGGKLINWVGLNNFFSLFAGDASNSISKEVGMNFGGVLLWTFIWAIVATISCYFGGILLALLLNKKEIKGKKFWRTIFILTIAIPQFISLLVMRNLLTAKGPINTLFGIETDWLAQSSAYAGGNVGAGVIWRVRITILVINLWIGIPYTMLMTSGILMNIPADLYEAATIDGANKFQMFRKITLPYIIFVTTPYLISSFIGNITAFNTIFLLTGGGPSKGTGVVAGETDLLVTWLYKLTIDNQLYNAGSVIGILTFIITSMLTLIFYRNSKAYKEEDTFQ